MQCKYVLKSIGKHYKTIKHGIKIPLNKQNGPNFVSQFGARSAPKILDLIFTFAPSPLPKHGSTPLIMAPPPPYAGQSE